MGRSNPDPVLRSELGARFTTIFSAGMENPHPFTAARTRSRASCTAVSGMPTMDIPGIPPETATSTWTGIALTPLIAALATAHCMRMAAHPTPNASM